jgi:hypothetical protein
VGHTSLPSHPIRDVIRRAVTLEECERITGQTIAELVRQKISQPGIVAEKHLC